MATMSLEGIRRREAERIADLAEPVRVRRVTKPQPKEGREKIPYEEQGDNTAATLPQTFTDLARVILETAKRFYRPEVTVQPPPKLPPQVLSALSVETRQQLSHLWAAFNAATKAAEQFAPDRVNAELQRQRIEMDQNPTSATLKTRAEVSTEFQTRRQACLQGYSRQYGEAYFKAMFEAFGQIMFAVEAEARRILDAENSNADALGLNRADLPVSVPALCLLRLHRNMSDKLVNLRREEQQFRQWIASGGLHNVLYPQTDFLRLFQVPEPK